MGADLGSDGLVPSRCLMVVVCFLCNLCTCSPWLGLLLEDLHTLAKCPSLLHLQHFTCLAGHWPVLWPFPQYLCDLVNLSLLCLPFSFYYCYFLYGDLLHVCMEFVPSWWNLVSVLSLPFSFLNFVLRSLSLTARVMMSVILISLADFLQTAQSLWSLHLPSSSNLQRSYVWHTSLEPCLIRKNCCLYRSVFCCGWHFALRVSINFFLFCFSSSNQLWSSRILPPSWPNQSSIKADCLLVSLLPLSWKLMFAVYCHLRNSSFL